MSGMMGAGIPGAGTGQVAPAMPPLTVDAICAELGLALDARQIAALTGYLALLLRWNCTYNLTAVRSMDGMLTRHLADCLAIVPALEAAGVEPIDEDMIAAEVKAARAERRAREATKGAGADRP